MSILKNKKIRTVIICFLVFFIWFGLSVYRTLGRNKDWFEPKNEVQEQAVQREDLETTNECEFSYATAWCKSGNNWALINIDGLAEIVLNENYTEVTNFENTGYAIVKDSYGNKTVIDRAGNSRLYDNCYICDSIVSNDFSCFKRN